MDKQKITSSIIKINPDLAKIYLSREENKNRAPSRTMVEKYAKEMKAGNWMQTHQGIAIGKNGALLDGQHRLMAIVSSGCTIPMLVITGLDSSTFQVMDVGRARNGKDVLTVFGISKKLAAAASTAAIMIHNYTLYRNVDHHYQGAQNKNQFILSFVKSNPELIKSAEFSVSILKKKRAFLAPGVVCFLHFEISKIRDNADDFLRAIIMGADLNGKSIILSMRDEIIESKAKGQKIRQHILIAKLMHTYNMWSSGKSLKNPGRSLSLSTTRHLEGNKIKLI